MDDNQQRRHPAPRHSEPVSELPEASDDLLRAAQSVRDLEYLKRKTPISSPAFHVLADRIQRAARRVFQLASRQRQIGNEAPREDATIDDIEAESR